MELLLNLFWVFLALPAYWLWRREVPASETARRINSQRGVLVLGCILMLLFPVISATDDLHAMRPEMEESGNAKRTLIDGGNDKTRLSGSSLSLAVWHPPAQFAAPDHQFGWVVVDAISLVETALSPTRSGRAPPSSLVLV